MSKVVAIFLFILGTLFMNYTAIGSSVTQFHLNFSKVSNVRLRGIFLREVKGVGSAVRCSALCAGTEACRSFNYGGTEKYCQLNRGTKTTNHWDAVADYSYYEMEALDADSRTMGQYAKKGELQYTTERATKKRVTTMITDGASTEKLTSTKEPSTSQRPSSSTRNPSSTEPITEKRTSTKEPSTSQRLSTRNPSSIEPITEEQTSTKEQSTSQKLSSSTRNPSSTEPITEKRTSTKEPSTSQRPSTRNPSSTEPITEEQTSTKEQSTSQKLSSSTRNPSSTEPITEKRTSTKEPSTSQRLSTENPITTPVSETVYSTCKAFRDDGYLTDGYYMIDPDGPEGELAFLVYCNMTTVGITIVDSTMFGQTIIVPVNTDPYEVDIEYYASDDQILALIRKSTRCYQFLLATCRNAKLWDGSTQLSWWVSREGHQMKNWGGVPTATEGCSCHLTQACSGGLTSLCNCGGVADEWSTDQGLLKDKDLLPVLELHFMNTAPSGELLFQIGSLECM